MPFIRPESLANDSSTTAPVISHALERMKLLGWAVRYACCIYPCAPLIQADDLQRGLDLLVVNEANFSYPVVSYSHPIQRAMRMMPNGTMQFLDPENELIRTQDFEKTFHDSGQFYWGKAEAWSGNMKMHTDGIGFEIPGWRTIDIDNPDDWRRAEILFGEIKKFI